MTADPDVVIAAWLDEGPTQLPDDVRHSITTSVRSIPQGGPGGDQAWRVDHMPTIPRPAIAAAAFVVAVVVAVAVIGQAGRRPSVGEPNGSPPPSLGATPSPEGSPTPSISWPPNTTPLGTITLTDTACHTFGFSDSVGRSTSDISIALSNATTDHATFGWYRLKDGRTWAEATAWVTAANAAIAAGTDLPPATFVTEERRWEVDAGGRDYLIVSTDATPGTYGMLCTAAEPPPGDLHAIYLVGPLNVD